MAALAAALVCGAFALFTGHRWEDYYITYRTSRNLVEGHGLVFQPGERVQAFTSPLGVLLPALALRLTGGQSDTAALWLFRLWSIAAFAGAAALLWRSSRLLGWSRFTGGLLVALLLTDAKSVDFAINGMETAFMLLCLAGTLHTLIRGGRGTAWRLGLWSAGLMWTRPDGFVFGGALAIAWLVVLPARGAAPHRRALLKIYGQAALVPAACYLPWIVWSWSYYGSFVPETVVAKGLHTHLPTWRGLAGLLARQTVLFPWRGGVRDLFLPAYVWFHGWPACVEIYAIGVAWLCLLYWIVPGAGAVGRTSSLALFLASLYGASVPGAPWYVPSYTLFGIVTIAAAFADLSRLFPGRRWLWAPFALHCGFAACLLIAVARQLRIRQDLIEGQRAEIGRWLRAHSRTPRDSVFLEPLGYIGYFSQLKMLDFPGLCAPEVVAARRSVGDAWPALIRRLRPDWLVLRPFEARGVARENPRLLTRTYHLMRRFDVSAKLAAIPWIPGRPYLETDQAFDVYRVDRSARAQTAGAFTRSINPSAARQTTTTP